MPDVRGGESGGGLAGWNYYGVGSGVGAPADGSCIELACRQGAGGCPGVGYGVIDINLFCIFAAEDEDVALADSGSGCGGDGPGDISAAAPGVCGGSIGSGFGIVFLRVVACGGELVDIGEGLNIATAVIISSAAADDVDAIAGAVVLGGDNREGSGGAGPGEDGLPCERFVFVLNAGDIE
ncbi:MAG: hypothetical protein ACYTE8_08105 [Planctomycetota bacterium]